jgi:hypothetical protein
MEAIVDWIADKQPWLGTIVLAVTLGVLFGALWISGA